MKGKFRKILGVGLVVALVASFSLVAAVPAAANVSQPAVTVSPNTQLLVGAEYTIDFSVTSALAAGTGTITIDFTDYGDALIPDTYTTGDVTVNGALMPDADVTASVDVVTINPVPVDIFAGDSVEVIFKASAGINNPSAGSYTLEVKTSGTLDTSLVPSASYIIAGYPGGRVSLYTSTGLFVNSYNTIGEALAADEANYTIEVDPGTYTPSATLSIDKAGVTLESTGDAAETIIDASGVTGIAIDITTADVTVDGFTVQDADSSAITNQTAAEGTIIQNNIITREVNGQGINLGAGVTGVTVTGNELDINSTMYLSSGADNCTLSDNTFGAGINLADDNDTITITGNTIIGSEYEGISFKGTNHDGILIQGNTISETIPPASDPGADVAGIYVRAIVTNLVITSNDITDNEGPGIKVTGTGLDVNAIKFNNITGNEDYGIENTGDGDVDATHNWWGTTAASEITAMISNTGAGTITYDPWLGASVSVADYAASASSLNAETTVGVRVTSSRAAEIGVAHYTGNPQEAPEFTAIDDGYFDVYVTAGWASGDMVAIKLYSESVTSTSKAYFYSEFYGGWQECYEQTPVTGNYVWVKVRLFNIDHPECVPTLSDLNGTPFAISGEEAPPDDPWIYDTDEDGEISKAEALNAIVDYFEGDITKDLALQVIALYFAS